MSQKTDYTAWHQSQPDEGLDKAVERIEGKGEKKMCTLCDEFRNKKSGTVMLDAKRIGDHALDVNYELADCGRLWLAVRIDGAVESAVAVEYCPKCGARIGGRDE